MLLTSFLASPLLGPVGPITQPQEGPGAGVQLAAAAEVPPTSLAFLASSLLVFFSLALFSQGMGGDCLLFHLEYPEEGLPLI